MTIGNIIGWAFGVLHLSRKDFYEMSPAEFWQALDAHSAEKMADRRHTGELARGLGVRIFNLFVSKDGKAKRLKDFWQMPWDGEDPSHEEDETRRLLSLKGDEMKNEIELFNQRIRNGSKATKHED